MKMNIWEEKVVNSFVEGYINKVISEKVYIIPPLDVFYKIMAFYKLDKAIYEAIYEINNRPEWISIPLKGILSCFDELKGV